MFWAWWHAEARRPVEKNRPCGNPINVLSRHKALKFSICILKVSLILRDLPAAAALSHMANNLRRRPASCLTPLP